MNAHFKCLYVPKLYLNFSVFYLIFNLRNWLGDHFPNRWIGRRGPVEWPIRFPGMSPPDFFLWGELKDAVYRHKPKTNFQLKQCIEEELQKITTKTSVTLRTNVCRSVVRRCRDCVVAQGYYFEHLH